MIAFNFGFFNIKMKSKAHGIIVTTMIIIHIVELSGLIIVKVFFTKFIFSVFNSTGVISSKYSL